MKNILSLLILLCLSLSARAQVITATVTATSGSGTVNGNTIVLNGTTRIFTNTVTVAATQILNGTNVVSTASNIYNAYLVKPASGVNITSPTTSTVQFKGFPGAALTLTIGGGWGTVSFSTNGVTDSTYVRVPLSNAGNSERTSVESGLVDYLNDNNGTNTIAGNAPFFVNFPSLTNANIFTAANTITNNGNVFAGSGAGLTNVYASFVTNANGTLYMTNSAGDTVTIVMAATGGGGTTNIIQSNPSGVVIGAILITPIGINGNAGPSLTNIAATNLTGQIPQTNFGGNIIMTNLNTVGTNILAGDMRYTRVNVTSLVDGGNNAFSFNGCFAKLTGPTNNFIVGGISLGADDRVVYLQNSSGFTMTIGNNSGYAILAGDRILTGTGADVVITNNPGFAMLKYDSTSSKWLLMFKSN